MKKERAVPTRNSIVLGERSTTSLVVLAILFGVFTIGLETVFHVSVKLPGHRAFPGALAMLVFAEAFAPLMLIAFAGLVSTILVASGHAQLLAIGVWMITALAIFGVNRTKLAHSLFYFVLCGTVFGLLRYLSSSWGFHHTPEMIRVGGHMGFGALGGFLAFGVARLAQRKEA